MDPIRKKFQLQLTNRFQVLQQQDIEGLEDTWNSFKDVMTTISMEILDQRKAFRDRWISDETWKVIEERRSLKDESWKSKRGLYAAKDKEVKRSARSDKRRWAESKAEEAEKAARQGDSKILFRVVKELSRNRRRGGVPIKQKMGRPSIAMLRLSSDGPSTSQEF
jgi:hypothetical protein